MIAFQNNAQGTIVPVYRHAMMLMLLSSGVFAEPLDFQQAVSHYLNHNIDLQLVRREVDKTKTDLITAQRRPNPVLLGEYQYLDPKNRFSDVSAAATALATVHLDHPFELGNKRDHRIENANENIELSKLQANETERQKLFDLIDAYYQVEEDKTALSNVLSNREDFEKILQIAQAKFEHGFLSQIDLQKLQLLALDYDKEISVAETVLAKDKEQLAFMLAMDPSALDTASAQEIATISLSVSELIANAQSKRPDCLASAQNIKAAESALGLQSANAVPDVTVGIEYEAYGPAYQPLVGMSVSMPLPVYDRNKGEIEKARIETLQASEMNKKTLDLAAMEVRQAYSALQNSQKLYGALLKGFESATAIKEKEEKIFALKGISMLELIDAQKNFREYQKNLTKAKTDLEIFTQQLKLYSALPLNANDKGL